MFGMILESVAVSWRDAEDIFGAQKEPLGSREVQGPIHSIGITVGNFQSPMLPRDDSECLRTLAHRLAILDPSWGKSEVAHDIANERTAIVI